MTDTPLLSPDQILQETAAFFGQPVQKLTAPGGRSRTSFRAYLPDRTVIVTQRRHDAQAHLELAVLTALGPLTDHVPQLLGTKSGLVFQSDLGANRLNWAIHATPPDQRLDLAARAVDSLFSLQRAARRSNLAATLPSGNLRTFRDDDLLAMIPRFARQMRVPLTGFDSTRLSPLFATQGRSFIKWDCRSGNAAVGADGKVRWFDFEEVRLGHGPEDFAWLIADEAWPIAAADMLGLVQARLTPDDTGDPDAFLLYLQHYATLQAARRIRLILHEAKRGWQDQATILKVDKVGVNPHFGERLALQGATLAARTQATEPLVPLFLVAANVFQRVRAAPET